MVCNACGHENQDGHPFCGMCGTPLPHPPLTTPGAQSTLDFTRVPRDGPTQSEFAEMARPAESASGGFSAATPEVPAYVSGAVARQAGSNLTEALARQDMIPEISLDEYVSQFHYEPPCEPEEITMRGDAAPVKPEASIPCSESATFPTETAAAAVVPPTNNDVQARLGLEPAGPTEAPTDRPHVLAIDEPLTEKPVLQPPKLAGPPFLETSESPQVAMEADAADGSGGRWRVWFAAAVIAVFGALGTIEWRARVTQTNYGPIEAMEMQRQNMPWSRTADADDNQAASADNSREKPQAVDAANGNQPPSAPYDTSQPDSSANKLQSSAGQSTASVKQTLSPDKASAAVLQKPASVTQVPTEEPRSTPSTAQKKGEEAITRTVLPGEEEMAKAKNARDAAATTAWQWRATVKGNPDTAVQRANLYLQGDGVPHSCEKAMVLLKQAAKKENVRARNRLASMYAIGICVPRDRVHAYHWLSSALAADPNNHWAQQNQHLIWQQMTPEERIQAQNER